MTASEGTFRSRQIRVAPSSRHPFILGVGVGVLAVLVASIVEIAARSNTAQQVDTTGWVTVVDRAARFTDRLPATPVDVTGPSASIGGEDLTLHLALLRQTSPTQAPGGHVQIAIGDEIASPPIPEADESANLREAIYSFAGVRGRVNVPTGGQ